MSEILLSLVHPVPVPWRARPGTRLSLKVRRAVTEGRIACVPEDAFRPAPFPFMADHGDVTRAFEHAGLIWERLATRTFTMHGILERRDIPVGRILKELGEGPVDAHPSFPEGTPLRALFEDQRAGDVDEGDPVQAGLLAGSRAALRRYLSDDLRIAGPHLYVRIGLPHLSGTGTPRLCGTASGWRPDKDMMLTRHDRVASHVRFVGRMQRDDEEDRFRYFAGLVEAAAGGILPDEMGLALFVNRLAVLTFNVFEVHDRRWRGEGRGRFVAMRRLAEGLAPSAALGMIGAVPPEDFGDCVRRSLSALDEADLGKSARTTRDEVRAYAEEVALPALTPTGPEVDSDLDDLSRLVP